MHYVIADIHGEVTKLKQLVNYIHFTDDQPEFIFIGDYVDKGEDVKATLDTIVELNKDYSCVFLMGNHEYCWINADTYEDYLLKYGGKNTVLSFNSRDIKDTQQILLNEYSVIFNNLIAYYIYDNYFLSHSGIDPQNYNIELNAEIDERIFLFNRYSFIKHQQLFKDRKVIFGHTGFYRPYVDDFKIGIDTGACYLLKQPLTSFCLETDTFYNSNRESYTLNSLKHSYCPNIIRTKPYNTHD